MAKLARIMKQKNKLYETCVGINDQIVRLREHIDELIIENKKLRKELNEK